MNVIHMRRIISRVAHGMFPKSPLPNTTLSPPHVNARAPFRVRHLRHEALLYIAPPRRIIRVAFRQCPKCVHMVRQHHPRIDMKWPLYTHRPHCFSQRCNFGYQQIALPVAQIHRKEIRSAWYPVAAIFRHSCKLRPRSLDWNAGNQEIAWRSESSLLTPARVESDSLAKKAVLF